MSGLGIRMKWLKSVKSTGSLRRGRSSPAAVAVGWFGRDWECLIDA